MNKAVTPVEVSLLETENNDVTFDWLYKEYRQPLFNQSYSYLKDYSVAEEIVQQLFINMFRKNIPIKQTANTGSYLTNL